MFCCTLLYVHSSIAIILMGKRELIALLNLSSWCLVMVEQLFLAVPRGCLWFVIVVYPDHTHLLFLCLWRKQIFVYIYKYFASLSMIKKYHNHKPQTTPWDREEELLNHHETSGRQIKQSNHFFPIKMIAILEWT